MQEQQGKNISDHLQVSIQHNNSNSSSKSDQYNDDSPFKLPPPTKLDLKSFWLGNTDVVLKNFDQKLGQLKRQQEGIRQAFLLFNENVEKYRLSSLRKIKIEINAKQLYTEYLLNSRQQIQKINPTLILNIFSYTQENLFYALVKARRISKIFNEIYKNESIQSFLAEKDYLEQDIPQPIKRSIEFCKKYVQFYRTFLHYKDIHYTQSFPNNSMTLDFADAVNFINQIHKIVYTKKSRDFTYFQLVNNFMTKNRVVIGLSSLSLTSLVLVRKAAIIAFSNYLALNANQRSHQQITKTKYTKVISVVEHENYKDTLIINTRISNYLLQYYQLNFAVFITNIGTGQTHQINRPQNNLWNILVFHRRNQLKTAYIQKVSLLQSRFQSAKIDLEFAVDMSWCILSTVEFQNWIKMEGQGRYLTSLLQNQESQEYFSYCWVYHLEEYFVIIMPSQI